MDITVRPMQEADFPACVTLLKGRLAYSETMIADLPRFWSRLLRDEAMNGAVFENRSGGAPPSMLALGVSVFVADAWVAEAKSSPEPYLTARTVWSELCDANSPILRPTDVRQSPAAALNVLILHYCEAPDIAPEVRPPLRYRVMQAFLETHRGYRIKEVLQELWDEIDPAFLLEGWGRVRNDYASYFTDRGEPIPPPGRRPYLIGFTREEARLHPGDLIAPVFTFTPARFLFSRAEKELLRQALLGRTDTELASALGIALPTVKSHWRTIYGRVTRVAPDLLPRTRPVRERGAIRGQEKRRPLLEYLRRHPEELNPALDDRRRADSRRDREHDTRRSAK